MHVNIVHVNIVHVTLSCWSQVKEADLKLGKVVALDAGTVRVRDWCNVITKCVCKQHVILLLITGERGRPQARQSCGS